MFYLNFLNVTDISLIVDLYYVVACNPQYYIQQRKLGDYSIISNDYSSFIKSKDFFNLLSYHKIVKIKYNSFECWHFSQEIQTWIQTKRLLFPAWYATLTRWPSSLKDVEDIWTARASTPRITDYETFVFLTVF